MIARSLVAALGAVCILSASPALAAPNPKLDPKLEMAKKHYAMGEQLFGLGSYKGAVEEFKEAYRLTRNPLLLYNIGFVYDKLADEPMALHYYDKFLADAPDSPKTHAQREQVANRAVEIRKAGAVDNAPEPATPTAAPAPEPAAAPAAPVAAPVAAPTPTPAAPVAAPAARATAPAKPLPAGAFAHELVEEAPPGRPIDVTARGPGECVLVLHYRSGGEEKFHDATMKARPGQAGELVARIPAKAVRGAALHYFIEAKRGASVVAASGSADTPNLIDLDPSAKPHFFVDTPADAAAAQAAPLSGADLGSPDRDGTKSKLTTIKWVATGTTVALLGAGIAFYIQAGNYASTLEGEAYQSGHECSVPPCRVYNPDRAGLESTGHMYQTLSLVSLGIGTAGVVATGVLWYLDAKRHHGQANEGPAAVAPKEARRFVAPMVGPGVVGATVGGTF